MQRTFVLIMLLLSVLWQGVAVAGQLPLIDSSEEHRHTVLHWTEHAHHHDEDGSFHADESDRSADHIGADGVASAPAIWSSAPPARLLAVRHSTPVLLAALSIPSPFLDRLRRPPRLTS